MSRRVSQQNKNKKSRNGKKVSLVRMNPPQMLSNVILNHKFRYQSNAAFSGSILIGRMLTALGVCCTVTNTTAALLFKSFKLSSIEMWSPPASQGAAATISIEWLGSANSPSREFADTTLSVSRNAHVFCRPPQNSLASFWQNGNSGTALFSLNVPINTVIDVNVSYIENDDEAAPDTVAIATGVLGNTYYLALDHVGSDILIPVRLTTTI
jgi:hypothetical protein